MKKEELRIGNYYMSVKFGRIVQCDLSDFYDLCAQADGAIDHPPINKMFEPIPLTEENIMRLRNERGHRLFDQQPPRERQTELQYYAEISDDTKLHLVPSYRYSDNEKGERVKNSIPEFWFNWSTDYGIGRSWFQHLIGIHGKHTLQYLHQFQNFWFALTGESLTLKIA